MTEWDNITSDDDDVSWLSLGYRGWLPFSVTPLNRIALSSICSCVCGTTVLWTGGKGAGHLLIFVAWRIVLQQRRRRRQSRLTDWRVGDNCCCCCGYFSRRRWRSYSRLNTARIGDYRTIRTQTIIRGQSIRQLLYSRRSSLKTWLKFGADNRSICDF